MRGGIGLWRNSNGIVRSRVIGEAAKLVSCSSFSTSSGSGGGGRGRGSFSPTNYDFGASSPGEVVSNEGLNDSGNSYPGMGRGHGRGKPLGSSPIVPSVNTFVASGEPPQQRPGLGLGRGVMGKRDHGLGNEGESGNEQVDGVSSQLIGEKNLPQSMMTVLSGTGRGKPEKTVVYEEKPKEVNRHVRPRRGDESGAGRGKDRYESKEVDSERKKAPMLSREEAVKRAVGILSTKQYEGEGGRGGGRDGGRGGGRGRGRGRGSREGDYEDEKGSAHFVGDSADGERLAKKLGPKVMAELTEALQNISTEILPDQKQVAINEELDLNLKIEFEPEYLMGSVEENPDISENPPIPIREALEKMKPVLMAYEGMESHEEWEEAVIETMKNAPQLKKILQHYAGPDRRTAKQQQAHLEEIAKRLPASAPYDVTRFTNRALLSLQSNPGWGFDKKCQFMHGLVEEVSQSYK